MTWEVGKRRERELEQIQLKPQITANFAAELELLQAYLDPDWAGRIVKNANAQ